MRLSSTDNPKKQQDCMHELHSSCYIFTTLRHDDTLWSSAENTAAADGVSTPIYLLRQHYDRLLDAAIAVFGTDGQLVLKNAGIDDAIGLEAIVTEVISNTAGAASSSCFRVRLQINKDSTKAVGVAAVQPLSLDMLFPTSFGVPQRVQQTWTVSLDTTATMQSVATQCKTHDRSDYDRARANAGIESFAVEQEVLLCDDQGNIIDASITTPYFYRRGQWLTPAAICGGQHGCTRRWALARGRCIEGVINIETLQQGEVIWLSNAARGFFKAAIRLNRAPASARDD